MDYAYKQKPNANVRERVLLVGLVRISGVRELEEERRKVAEERLLVKKSKTEMSEIVRKYEKGLETAKDTIEMLKRKYVE